VIIKKDPETRIDDPIGAIFRRVNIVEYKSPGDHLSIGDFHQVNAYGRLYSVLNRVETRDMTLSFVTMAHPRKLLDYLRREYRFEIREGRPGIYYVQEGTFAAQIIESKRLEGGSGGIGLGDLRGGLNEDELWQIIEKIRRMPEGAPLSAYLHTLAAANKSGLRGITEVSDVLTELLEEQGFAEKWKAATVKKLWEQVQQETRGELWEETREKIREEVMEKARKEVLEKIREETLEKLREEVMEKAREETLEKLREEALEKLREEVLEKAREEALEKARAEALEKAREEALERTREEALEKARVEALKKAREEALEKAREEVLEKAREEALEKDREEGLEKDREEGLEIKREIAAKDRTIEDLRRKLREAGIDA
jgi:hypothetical protein